MEDRADKNSIGCGECRIYYEINNSNLDLWKE